MLSLWCQPMSNILRSVIQNHLLGSSRSNIGVLQYRESNEKKAITRCCLLTSYSVLGTHLLNCATQVKSEYFIRIQEVFGKFTTGLTASSSKTCGRQLRGSYQRDRSSEFRLQNYPQRFDVIGNLMQQQTTLNELLRYLYVSTSLLDLGLMCVRKNNDSTHTHTTAFPSRKALIYVSLITCHTA